MLGSQILEIAMGLFFIYLFFSVIWSALNEFVAWALHLRARNLKQSLSTLFEGPDAKQIAEEIYRHPVVSGLTLGDHKPSYISARAFSVALLDVAMKKAKTVPATTGVTPDSASPAAPPFASSALKLNELRTAAESLAGTSQLDKVLVCLLDESVSDLKDARENVENWFNEAMEAASRYYKRKTYGIVLALAVIVTLGLNLDTVAITKALWTNGNLRAALAAQAEAFRQSSPNAVVPDPLKGMNRGQALELPMGWGSRADFRPGVTRASTLLGLLLTVVAVSLGAPFWFDALNKIGNLRASGRPHETKPRANPATFVVEGPAE